VKLIAAFIVLLAVAATLNQATRASSPVGTVPASAASALQPCQAGDQDPFAYRPARLQLLHACLRITGTIVSRSVESDGDVHINVRLDPQYQGVLVDGNQFEDGYLIVEPVCQYAPLLGEAIRVCAADPDPLAGPLPAVGDHVWMEGRYILDLQHHAWAELHPLYRWGLQNP
jgi:hypothetical protein